MWAMMLKFLMCAASIYGGRLRGMVNFE